VTRVTVVIPKARVDAVRNGLRTSHGVVAEDLDHVRRERPDSPHLAASAARLAELCILLDQLRHPSARGQTVTGDYEPLRVAVCDALVTAIEELACAAHSHWNQRPTLSRVRRRLGAVAGCVALLERLEQARAGTARRRGD
jgi:hypothetical protein